MIEKAERFVGQGYKAIKMQVAHLFTPDEDVVNVRDMRAALGPDIGIMVDVNQGWDAETAIATATPLAVASAIPADLETWIAGRTYAQLFDEARNNFV